MKYLVIVVLTVIVTLGVLSNIHFVVYDDGVKIVRKEKLTLDEFYIDARDMNPVKWLKLPPPVRAALTKESTEKMKKDLNEGVDKLGEDIKQIFK